MIITVLHPGAMGAAVAAEAVAVGHQVLWVPDGRSPATRTRAEQAGLTAAGSLQEALDASELVICVCPPQAAEDLATTVAAHDYQGIYLDANAISPQRAERIAHAIRPAPVVVDGAILGPPPTGGRSCRLYLAGPPDATDLITRVFTGTTVHPRTAGEAPGAASALKMAFAAFQKSARTLAAVSHALADTHGVSELLTEEAAVMPADILADPGYLPSVAARAWRWAPEMTEIADTLRTAGLPVDLATATAAVLTRWSDDKDRYQMPLDEVFDHLRDST
ncbi:DUF1932 domain-containing protein [Streptomyces sp. NPDC051018]|uniref:DUF1932 domain-containing protein n=1 Tax=Streptomyces sp. NPDC051018 TaxID=3365639 RepID=UPI0037B20A79